MRLHQQCTTVKMICCTGIETAKLGLLVIGSALDEGCRQDQKIQLPASGTREFP